MQKTLQIIRTNSADAEFIGLVQLLDKELAVYDGAQHEFYDQYNKVNNIKYILVGYVNDEAVACGAIKEWKDKTMEVKRMFVKQEHRGNGYSKRILDSLEAWAAELGYTRCILETGKGQLEAVALYTKANYQVMPNYGQYDGIENSVCFEKLL